MTQNYLSSPVAQWIGCLPGVQEHMGLIPLGDSDFFFVSLSCHVGQFTYHCPAMYMYSDLSTGHHFSPFEQLSCSSASLEAYLYVLDSFFSWNVGPAHIISISTEVYFFYQYGIEQIVQQYEWLEKDLQVRIKSSHIIVNF